jgi:hypothetical protein
MTNDSEILITAKVYSFSSNVRFYTLTLTDPRFSQYSSQYRFFRAHDSGVRKLKIKFGLLYAFERLSPLREDRLDQFWAGSLVTK